VELQFVRAARTDGTRADDGRLDQRFREHLDSLFTMQLDDKYFAKTEDITRDGIMGNYVHGNEPSHHVPYLYNYSDRPWMTGKRVRDVLDQMYNPCPMASAAMTTAAR
jgi:putative alpha-1,2-mannosidase